MAAGARALSARLFRGSRGAAAVAAACGLIALALRWRFAVQEHPPTLFLTRDMAIYAEQGARMFRAARDAWDTFTPPGYPAVIALVGVAHLGAAQAIAGALAVFATALFGYRLDGSRWTAAVAGVAAACYFPLIFYTGLALTETFFSLALLLFAHLLLAALRRRAIGIGVAAGLAFAAGALIRPSLIVFTPFLLLFARKSWACRAAAIAAALALAPVAIQTSVLLGRPALVASNGGVNFFLAFSDCRSVRSNAGGRVVEVSTHYGRTHWQRRCAIDTPLDDEPPLYRAALARIAREPHLLLAALDGLGEGLGLAPARRYPAQAFWPGSIEHGDELNAFSRAYFWALLLPALAHAAVRARRRRRRADRSFRQARALGWALLGSVGIALYAFNGNPRVRVSSDPLTIALAASAAVALVRAAIRFARRPRAANRAPTSAAKARAAQARLAYQPALDGLRGVAILLVLGHHLPRGDGRLLPGGFVGVDLFFVLSGALITTLLLREHEVAGRIDFAGFYLRRATRLLPALLAMLAFCVAYTGLRWAPQSSAEVRADAWYALFYLSSWVNLTRPHRLLSMTWSLSIEEWFYIAWPVALVALLSARSGGRRAVGLMLGLVIVACFAWREWLWQALFAPARRLYFGLDTRADALAFGALVALAAQRRLGWFERARPWAARLGWAALFAASLGADYHTDAYALFGYAGLGLAASFVVLDAMRDPPRWLAFAPLVAVGRLSYSLYLWMLPVLSFTASWPLAARLAVLSAAAWGSYWLIEQPGLALRRPIAALREASR